MSKIRWFERAPASLKKMEWRLSFLVLLPTGALAISVGRTLKCRNRSTWNLFPDVIFNVQDISSFRVLTHFYRPSIPAFNLQFSWQNAVEIKFISRTMPPYINLILFFDMNCTPPPSSIFPGNIMAVAVEKDSRGSHIAAFQAQLIIQIQGRCGLHSL